MNKDQRKIESFQKLGQRIDSMGPLERSKQTGKLLAAALVTWYAPDESLTEALRGFPAFNISQSSHGHAEA